MNFKTVIAARWFKPALGAALTAFCGLLLWGTPLGDAWENASYDYLFRFGHRAVTNQVVLIRMDSESYNQLHQNRDQPWDRALHTALLNKLTDGGCRLVVFDVFFETETGEKTDAALAKAMQRHGQVVLGAEINETEYERSHGVQVIPLNQRLATNAAGWGIGRSHGNAIKIARRHWPFPAPADSYFSLPWIAAQLSGARLNANPEEQWLRYYGEAGGWKTIPYHIALSNARASDFRDKIVFIGSHPQNDDPYSPDIDKFSTPYTRWTGQAVGGMEILATEYLNLMNGDWLRRAPGWVELLALLATGSLLGAGFCLAKSPLKTGALALAVFVAVTLGAVAWSYYTDFWFPWLVIAGGQVPCALVWAVGTKMRRPIAPQADWPPRDYELFEPPIGEGTFGKVWLARNVIGEWKALKAVYRAECEKHNVPYEVEFVGLKNYKPISNEHPGLLHLEHVVRSEMAGFFYYVMELGDSLDPGWKKNPRSYQPRDLENECAQTGGRLPVRTCVQIMLTLTEALHFLHEKGFAHRDIKPRNLIFVNGRPKLADVGLVAGIRPYGEEGTIVGTPGYMPPPPETPGTAQADIYALGMVLYVIGTGLKPCRFSDIATTLVEGKSRRAFMLVNAVILKACHPDCQERYQTASEMHAALLQVEKAIAQEESTEQV